MRSSLLPLGLFYLAGWVCSNALPAGFGEPAAVLSTAEEELDTIVGGTPANPKEFPFLAALKVGDKFICGGSLVKHDVIVTAAHCLYGRLQSSVNTFRAVLNSNSLSGEAGSVTISFSRFVIHPKYNASTFDNDVALLFSTSRVTGVKTIALPCPIGTGDFAGRAAVIAGYGTTSVGGSISNTLLKANVNILTNVACNAQYGNINNNKICAAAPGKDTCQGDSGGPLIVNGFLAGITSYGRGCADPNFAGVYARVTTYTNWIMSTN